MTVGLLMWYSSCPSKPFLFGRSSRGMPHFLPAPGTCMCSPDDLFMKYIQTIFFKIEIVVWGPMQEKILMVSNSPKNSSHTHTHILSKTMHNSWLRISDFKAHWCCSCLAVKIWDMLLSNFQESEDCIPQLLCHPGAAGTMVPRQSVCHVPEKAFVDKKGSLYTSCN